MEGPPIPMGCMGHHGIGPGFGFRFAVSMMRGRGKYVIAVAATVIGIVKVARFVKMRKLREKWANAGKDVVVLHTFPRGNYYPCLVPFSVKLETFFRMMDIKYELDFEEPKGPKNKVPWITVNGEDYSDSQLIVQKLQVMVNKFPDANVPKEDKAVGLAMRIMLEEHFYWGIGSWRFVEDNTKSFSKIQDFPPHFRFMLKFAKGTVSKCLYSQGLGRHSFEELHSLMKLDLEALSAYIGDKDYVLGSSPHTVDCSVFAFLSTVLYNCPGSPYEHYIKNDFPNLTAYTDRVKQRFWPDWNQCIKKPTLTL